MRPVLRSLSRLRPGLLFGCPRYHLSAVSNRKSIVDELRAKAAFLEQMNPAVRQAHIVVESKNNCLYVKDTNNEFGLLSEVTTDAGQKGVVVDIRDKIVGIALYSKPKREVKAVSKSQSSSKQFDLKELRFGNVYDIEQNVILKAEKQDPISEPQPINKKLSKANIPISNPILYTCYDIKLGSLNTLQGHYGTGKTAAAIEIIKGFHSLDRSNNITLYLSYNVEDCKRLDSSLTSDDKVLFFSQDSEDNSDAGGLFLAQKVVNLARSLRDKGFNVLVCIEKIEEVMRRQKSLFKNFDQPFAPFSIINQLYCMNSSNKLNSVTTIFTLSTQSEKNKNKVDYPSSQQSLTTPFSNSLTHLYSLCTPIKFPLALRINNSKSTKSAGALLSQYINTYLRLAEDYQTKSKLKLNHEPWENYFLLDAEWWVPSLKSFKADTPQQIQGFVRFLEWNITNDTVANWTVKAHEAYALLNKWKDEGRFISTSQTPNANQQQQLFEWFVGEARLEGIFSPFKKDYLS